MVAVPWTTLLVSLRLLETANDFATVPHGDVPPGDVSRDRGDSWIGSGVRFSTQPEPALCAGCDDYLAKARGVNRHIA